MMLIKSVMCSFMGIFKGIPPEYPNPDKSIKFTLIFFCRSWSANFH